METFGETLELLVRVSFASGEDSESEPCLEGIQTQLCKDIKPVITKNKNGLHSFGTNISHTAETV